MARVTLVPIDPYDLKTGALVPFILDRIRKMSAERNDEQDPIAAMTGIATRVYSRDPSICLVAFLDEKYNLVGHAVASMESDGVNTWCFISQLGMDPGDWGDAVTRALDEGDKYCKWFSETYLVPNGKKPVQKMLMATHREGKAWQRKYGFESHRHVMMRDVGTPVPEESKERT